jgi:hypothetical protein
VPLSETSRMVSIALTQEPFALYLLSRMRFTEVSVVNLMTRIRDVSLFTADLYFMKASFLVKEFVKEIYYQQVSNGFKYNCLENWVMFHNMFTMDLLFFIINYNKIRETYLRVTVNHAYHPNIIEPNHLKKLRAKVLEYEIPKKDSLEIVSYAVRQFISLDCIDPPRVILKSPWGFLNQCYAGLLYYSKGFENMPSWKGFFGFLAHLMTKQGEEWQQTFHDSLEIGKVMRGKNKDYIFGKLMMNLKAQMGNLLRDPVATELMFKLLLEFQKILKLQNNLRNALLVYKSLEEFNAGPYVRWFYCKYSIQHKYEEKIMSTGSVIPY